MNRGRDDAQGLWEGWLGDGRFFLGLVAFCLAGSGAFALFLCVTGHFLPHDVAWLGMDAQGLSRVGGNGVVSFMFHDRAAFAGALLAIGVLYGWLICFPLAAGEAWAWWTLAIPGGAGFASFLTYLSYGYLDSWHGTATLALLPLFIVGMVRAKRLVVGEGRGRAMHAQGWSRRLLTAYGGGLVLGGATISVVGMTTVFVPQDLVFIGHTRLEICGFSERLIPLIAHDRAGFGGGLISTGLIILGIAGWARPSRGCCEALLLSGAAGFGCAIGVHWAIGYTDISHLAPAYAGAGLYAAALGLFWREARVSADGNVKDGAESLAGECVGQKS